MYENTTMKSVEFVPRNGELGGEREGSEGLGLIGGTLQAYMETSQ
jgi:hypothetical protein